MDKFLLGLLAALLLPFALAVFAVAAVGDAHEVLGGEPSGEAIGDIPAELLPHYRRAAETCPGLSWTIVAAVAKVETDHARFGSATMNAHGDVTPWIIGIPLDGTRGTRAIRDTDGGRWDRDPVWDRAVGPMQFIPSTWRVYGVDATGSGEADPHNFIDAVYSAARYLCANGASEPARLRQAVFRYNNSWAYVDQVLAIAERYSTASLQHGSVGDYALPVDRDRLSVELIRRPHHSYPAWDLGLPVGTQVYAVHGGTVIATPVINSRCGLGVVVAGRDGARYTYCHASALQVSRGQEIQPGQPIMRSGNTGRSTGPHLHLDIRWQGELVCPQPLLEAWYEGRHATPAQAPRGGCFY